MNRKTAATRPRRLSRPELKRAGVSLGDAFPNQVRLTCDRCRTSWRPNLLRGARMPRGYWKCPNGCNA